MHKKIQDTIGHYYSKSDMDDPTVLYEIKSRWDKLGFLGGALNKRNVALGMELMTYTLLTTDELDPTFNIIMFPIVNRVLRNVNEDLPVDKIEAMVDDFIAQFPIEELKDKANDPKYAEFIDIEAVLVSRFCDEVKLKYGMV